METVGQISKFTNYRNEIQTMIDCYSSKCDQLFCTSPICYRSHCLRNFRICYRWSLRKLKSQLWLCDEIQLVSIMRLCIPFGILFRHQLQIALKCSHIINQFKKKVNRVSKQLIACFKALDQHVEWINCNIRIAYKWATVVDPITSENMPIRLAQSFIITKPHWIWVV